MNFMENMGRLEEPGAVTRDDRVASISRRQKCR